MDAIRNSRTNASADFTLYTAATPNGWKVSIALEELGASYNTVGIDLFKGEQKHEMFLGLNPNGRIPVLIDHTEDDFVLSESGAILWYLAEKGGHLLPSDPLKRTLCNQWLMFQMSAVGPMMGQLNVFRRYFDKKIPEAITRYHRETERIFRVLNDQLEGRAFILEEHSLADIAIWSWVYTHRWSGISLDSYPHLMRWKRALRARPAYQRGVAVPYNLGRVLDQGEAKEGAIIKGAQKIIIS